MYCTACGNQVRDMDNFCPNCGQETPRARESHEVPRRLYRLRYDRKIAGVCSGFAKYLDIDVTLVRLVAVVGLLLSCGAGLIAYIVAWIIMPIDEGPRVFRSPVRTSTQPAQ
jgi:phage shock protein C